MKHRARTYQLTAELVGAHGGPVVCIDAHALGKTYRLHENRPGPELNERFSRAGLGPLRADVIGPEGEVLDVLEPDAEETAITIVSIRGAIEQRAGYHDICAGWSDGHDAIAERLCAALEDGDVCLVIDSPGGAHAGLEEGVRRVLEAKEQFGRRITGHADEMIGSAAYWWAACVCDEVYGPASMVVGSIGARAAHASVAGALAQEGVSVTYFAAPGPGKVAFAPELPLSDLGKERGERDVWLAFESFAAAVGPARGLTRDDIIALDADALSGQAAVDAKLVDGIASLEDVLTYALTNASAEATATSEEGTEMKIKASAAPGVRADGDGDDGDEEDRTAEGTEPSSACKACGSANEENSKFCDQCGASMAAAPEGDEPEAADPPPDEPAPGKKPPPPGPAAKAQPPPEKKEFASLASVFGLRAGASQLAIKTAAIAMRSTLERCMAATGTATVDTMVGAVIAHAGDARRLAKVEGDMRAMQTRADWAERMDLLRKLSAANLPGYTRGELLVTHVDEMSGKKTVRPAPVYAEMKLGTLRGLVAAKLQNGASAKRTPFEPDAEPLKEGGVGVTAQDREIAEKHGYKPEDVARSRAALFSPNAQRAGA